MTIAQVRDSWKFWSDFTDSVILHLAEKNIIYKFDRVILDIEVDCLTQLPQKHLLRVIDLLLVSVVIIFNFQLPHVKVCHYCALHVMRK